MRSLVLAIVLPLAVSATGLSQITNGDWTYTVDPAQVATITAYTGSGSEIAIPGEIDGYPVRVVGVGLNIFGAEWGSENTTVRSVSIPDGVTSIGDNALGHTPALTNVVIPDSVTSIGRAAFSRSTTLRSVDVPAGVTSIAAETFYDCYSLTNVTIPEGVTAIGETAFGYCGSLVSVTVPASVTAIERTVFYGCSALRSLFILGNEPTAGADIFGLIAPSGTVYYVAGATGWSQTFAGWPTSELPISPLISSVGASQFLRGRASVATNPSAFNLFTESQYNNNRVTGRSEGRAEVINNPASYNLYTSNSIMDLNLGGMMLQKQGSNAIVVFQPQTTTDLGTLPFTNSGTPITNEIPMPGNKGFIRVRALGRQ